MEEEKKEQTILDTLQQQWNMFQSIQTAKTMLFQKYENEHLSVEEPIAQNHYSNLFAAPIGMQVDVNA